MGGAAANRCSCCSSSCTRRRAPLLYGSFDGVRWLWVPPEPPRLHACVRTGSAPPLQPHPPPTHPPTIPRCCCPRSPPVGSASCQAGSWRPRPRRPRPGRWTARGGCACGGWVLRRCCCMCRQGGQAGSTGRRAGNSPGRGSSRSPPASGPRPGPAAARSPGCRCSCSAALSAWPGRGRMHARARVHARRGACMGGGCCCAVRAACRMHACVPVYMPACSPPAPDAMPLRTSVHSHAAPHTTTPPTRTHAP